MASSMLCAVSAATSMSSTERTALYLRSCSKLAQKSMAMVRIWISTGISSFLSMKYTGMRTIIWRLR